MEGQENTQKDTKEWVKGQIIALKKLGYSNRGIETFLRV